MNVFGQLKQAQPELVTTATLPSASANPWRMVFATDAKTFYVSDGVNWLSFGQPGLPGNPGDMLVTAASTAPMGWLFAHGQSLLRTDYPALFTAIGTQWGAVDSTHFSLPDMRGNFIRGAGGNFSISFDDTAVDTGSSTITYVNHGFNRNSLAIKFFSSDNPTATLPSPLAFDTEYYVIVTGDNTFKLATTRSNALTGTAITLLSTGNSTPKILYVIENPDRQTQMLSMEVGGIQVYQLDQNKSHNHDYLFPISAPASGNFAAGNNQSTNSLQTSAQGGDEARPKVISLNWIIKT